MDTSQLIANRIIELCRERNITVGKLCTMGGATGSTVSDIMNGVTKNPGILTIKKLCDAAGITLAEFFDTEEFNSLEQEIK
ncbi:MAG: helix-turn-helix domain-containing protein [Clostridia bacterium]